MRGFRCSGWLVLTSILLLLSVVVYASNDNPPVAAFVTNPTRPSTNDKVLFDAGTSVGKGAQISRYEWDFDGDGLIDVSTDQPQVRYFFDQSGPHNVTLQVRDSAGGTNTLIKSIDVIQAPLTTRRTLEMTLMPNRVLAGGSFFVTVTLRVNQQANGLGLVEQLPAGWRARPMSEDGALFKRAGEALQWLWAQSIVTGQTLTVRYEVSVPETAARGTYTLEGTVSSFSPSRIKLPVLSVLDVEVL